MCQRLPGARCSSSARQKLLTTQKAFKATSSDNEDYEGKRRDLAQAQRDYYSTPEGLKNLEVQYSNCMKLNNYAGAEKVSRHLNDMIKLGERRRQGLQQLLLGETLVDAEPSNKNEITRKVISAAKKDLGPKPSASRYRQYIILISQKAQDNLDFLKKEKNVLERHYADCVDQNDVSEGAVFLDLLLKNKQQVSQTLLLTQATSEQVKKFFDV